MMINFGFTFKPVTHFTRLAEPLMLISSKLVHALEKILNKSGWCMEVELE